MENFTEDENEELINNATEESQVPKRMKKCYLGKKMICLHKAKPFSKIIQPSIREEAVRIIF